MTTFEPIAVYTDPASADIYNDELEYLKDKLTYDGASYRVTIEEDESRDCDFLCIEFKEGYNGAKWGGKHTVKAIDKGLAYSPEMENEAVLLYCAEFRPGWKSDNIREATAFELQSWIEDAEASGDDCDDLKSLLARF